MPKSNFDWLAIVSLWIGALVWAIKSLDAPLMPGAPQVFAAGFWNTVPLVLISAALAMFLIRVVHSPQASVSEEGLDCGASLRLQFYGDDRHPTASRASNVATWFAYYSGEVIIMGLDSAGAGMEVARTSKAWAIFITYDRPTQVSQIVAGLNAAGLCRYQILQSTTRACVISFERDIPVGELEIDIRA